MCESAYQIVRLKSCLTERKILQVMKIFSNIAQKIVASDNVSKYNTEFEKSPESDEETQNGMDCIFRI